MLLGRFLNPVDVVDIDAARPLLLDVLHHLGRAAVALAAGGEEPRSPLLAGEHDGGGPTAGEREAGLLQHATRELLDRGDLLVGRVGGVIVGRARGFPVRGLGRGVVRGVASASSAEDPAIGFPRGGEHLREEVRGRRVLADRDLVGEEDPSFGSLGRRGDGGGACGERRLGAAVGEGVFSRAGAPGSTVEGRGGDAAAPAAAAHRACRGRVQRVIVLHRDQSARDRAPIRPAPPLSDAPREIEPRCYTALAECQDGTDRGGGCANVLSRYAVARCRTFERARVGPNDNAGRAL